MGAVYKHWPAKTVTEADDHLFCLITMNHHPLHINDVYAAQSQQGRNVVVGPLVYSLALGMSVSDVVAARRSPTSRPRSSSTPRRCSTATRCSASPRCSRSASRSPSPTAARSSVHTRVLNQDGVLVAEFKRLVLVPRKNARAAADDRATASALTTARRSGAEPHAGRLGPDGAVRSGVNATARRSGNGRKELRGRGAASVRRSVIPEPED